MSDSIFSSPRIVNDLVYKTLIESTLAIPWSIDWGTKKFSYIGPQIEKVLGWKQDSWRTVEDWAMRIHENDRAWVVDFCVAQSISGVDHEADYRALTINGEYIWIRDSTIF
jgi:PAS domain-containing protein